MIPRQMLRATAWALSIVVLFAATPLLTLAFAPSTRTDWRTAGQRSTGQAPDPAAHPEAVVQAYAGRTYGWRGAFAVHTWLAAKPANADRDPRYEVIGWYVRSGHSAVSVSDLRAPDAEWYGSAPQLLRDVRGHEAEAIIARLPAAVAAYPYPDAYSAWPGPNSNTFIAHLARELPALHLALPSNAIGKDYLPGGAVFARTPSGTGWQLSLGGLFGVLAGPDEGFEINVLGLVTGLDVRAPALKLPGIGRVPSGGTS